ncbi:hypothetical protein RUM43_004173 [Polyplax serrata]|uniref:Uncharacterized protein n=1 Tax=Polyplax serrata TaxID=468196 RepID=A0AAN8XMR8_POLSC
MNEEKQVDDCDEGEEEVVKRGGGCECPQIGMKDGIHSHRIPPKSASNEAFNSPYENVTANIESDGIFFIFAYNQTKGNK